MCNPDLTDQEINKRIAEFMGWKNLEWREASSHLGITIPSGWYGQHPSERPGCMISDYVNSVDDLIPVTEKLRADGKYLATTVYGRNKYAATLWDTKDKLWGEGMADSMAMAICHAVMTFLEKE